MRSHQSLLNIAGMVPGSIALVCMGYTNDPTAAVILLNICVGLIGLHIPSVCVNCLDIAPKYSGILKGISKAISASISICGLPIVGALTSNQVSFHSLYSKQNEIVLLLFMASVLSG